MTLTLDLPATETFTDWTNLGRKLCASHRMVNWLIGDWLIDGSERFGDKARDEARAIFRSDVDRFDPIVKTCRRFPATKRHDALTFGHHLAVMPVADDTEAERLLSDAETHGLTAPMLKAQVKINAGSRQEQMPDDDPEDAAYRRLVHAWNMAPRSAREALVQEVEDKGMGVIEL